MKQQKKSLIILASFLLLSFLSSSYAQDIGYGWNDGPTYPPAITPTANPTPTVNPTETPTSTPEPTSNINPIQSTNPTPKPTPPKIPEITIVILLIGAVAISFVAVVYTSKGAKKQVEK
jgi:hypothetical protein